LTETGQQLDLILNISKPIGWTSFDVVRRIKNCFSKTKVGHAGTLDPFAEGVLLVCVGKATKKVPELMDQKKEYVTTLEFGKTTDTLDISGNVLDEKSVSGLSVANIEEKLQEFLGEIEQVPPAFSALRVNGQRAYDLARRGDDPDLKSRIVQIDKFDLVDLKGSEATFKILCSKGTYIRSLARDLALSLDTVGYLRSLTRTKVGPYELKDSIKVTKVHSLYSEKQ
jgi:tRNA pseudouridine55 synthase